MMGPLDSASVLGRQTLKQPEQRNAVHAYQILIQDFAMESHGGDCHDGSSTVREQQETPTQSDREQNSDNADTEEETTTGPTMIVNRDPTRREMDPNAALDPVNLTLVSAAAAAATIDNASLQPASRNTHGSSRRNTNLIDTVAPLPQPRTWPDLSTSASPFVSPGETPNQTNGTNAPTVLPDSADSENLMRTMLAEILQGALDVTMDVDFVETRRIRGPDARNDSNNSRRNNRNDSDDDQGPRQ